MMNWISLPIGFTFCQTQKKRGRLIDVNQIGHFLPSQAMPADHAHIIKATHQFWGWKTIAKMPNNNNPAETIYSSVLIGRNIIEPPHGLIRARKLAEWYYRNDQMSIRVELVKRLYYTLSIIARSITLCRTLSVQFSILHFLQPPWLFYGAEGETLCR